METIKINKIKDIEEFCKLFKINIPMESEFEYYFDLLKMSKEYYPGELDKKYSIFCQLEELAIEKGYANAFKYKMSEIDWLKTCIMASDAYKDLNSVELPKTKLYSRDWLSQVSDGQYLISLDFVSANYSVLKTFDLNNSLSDNWAEYCKVKAIPEALIHSKSFRQVVFGNTNPKRLQTFQHDRIIKVVEYLKSIGYDDSEFVFISHDEIILKIEDASDALRIQIQLEACKRVASEMSIKSTVFSMKKIKKNTYVKTVYDIDSNIADAEKFNETYKLFANFVEQYKTLHGVSGNKFYFYYKKYILDQPLDDRDLIYYNDGELCKWIDEDVKTNKNKTLPHYEKPEKVVSMKSAINDYTSFWNKLSEELPDMSNEEKRRVIEIAINNK